MQPKKILSLDGAWQMYFVANKQFVTAEADISTPAALAATGWQCIPAQVPGNFELDFERAGRIGDPFFGTNMIENQRFENLHILYTREIDLDFVPDRNTFLHFEGIDTIAEIFVNGVRIGETDNMLIPFEFSRANLKQGKNEIVLHITPAHIAGRNFETTMSDFNHQVGYDTLAIRKAPHMQGWDIMPRAVSAGIWRTCYIEQKRPDRIDDVYFYVTNNSWTELTEKDALLSLVYNTTLSEDYEGDYSLEFEGVCGDSRFSQKIDRLWHTGGVVRGILVKDCKFWWPRNYGEPNLYDITFKLRYKGQVVDEKHITYGIRTVQLERTSTTSKDGDGEFCFIINGKRIFAMGTNWVPVDAFHSRDKERLPEILPMLSDLGCNIIRCWGGNVYEDDLLYDYCDRHGIMIWQDFSHACSINPQNEEYCHRFYREVETIVKRLRGHASIVLWAGDNEVDECIEWWGTLPGQDPNENVLTRKVIPAVLHIHDLTRPYLPSSPYIDEEAHRSALQKDGRSISEDHLWGPRDYFKGDYYRTSVCHFASETGYHGCPSPESLKKYIHADQLWHWRSAPDSDLPKPDWGAHSAAYATDGSDACVYRIRLMSNQVKTLFGEEPDNLEDFARASQISQAEAKKYFIERFRVTKWRRTGIIWWNLIDGWPQISDAVVDYTLCKKLAYHYIKRSQQPLCLIFDEPTNGVLPLHAVSDLQEDVRVNYRVTDLTEGKVVAEGEAFSRANSSDLLWNKPMAEDEQHFYFIEWSYTDAAGNKITGKNHYMTNILAISLEEYYGYLKQCGFWEEFSGFC